MGVTANARLIVLASLIASSISLMTDCNVDILSSDSAYEYVVKNYGTNATVSAKELCTFMKKLRLLHSSSMKLDCSALNNLANFNNGDTLINSTAFSDISSNVLIRSDKDFCQFYKKTVDNNLLEGSSSAKPSEAEVWGFGILAVTIISLCSLVGISILPLMKSQCYDKILLYLIALAVGTLSSNAIFQLIPEGFGIYTDPMAVWFSAVIFGGFYLFYLIESVLERIFNTSHSAVDLGPSIETDSSFSMKIVQDQTIPQLRQNHQQDKDLKVQESTSSEVALDLPADSDATEGIEVDFSTQSSLRPASVLAAKQKQCSIFKNFRSIKTVAWMITVADGIHNFIDGLVIGTSFSVSLFQGLSTSIAIFCEEFPHELGDFAILISSGMTIRQAAFYNFASACCCYLGLVVGILIGGDISSAQWIFALAGGVFLYISLAGMLPEAQAHCTKNSLKDSPWLCFFIKNAGLLTGFVIMLMLTLYGDEISVG